MPAVDVGNEAEDTATNATSEHVAVTVAADAEQLPSSSPDCRGGVGRLAGPFATVEGDLEGLPGPGLGKDGGPEAKYRGGGIRHESCNRRERGGCSQYFDEVESLTTEVCAYEGM
jgi:hypothetical protein